MKTVFKESGSSLWKMSVYSQSISGACWVTLVFCKLTAQSGQRTPIAPVQREKYWIPAVEPSDIDLTVSPGDFAVGIGPAVACRGIGPAARRGLDLEAGGSGLARKLTYPIAMDSRRP